MKTGDPEGGRMNGVDILKKTHSLLKLKLNGKAGLP